MDEEKIDDGNALMSATYITQFPPEEVVEAFVDIHGGPYHTPYDLREIAARLCILGGALMEAVPQARKNARKRRAMMEEQRERHPSVNRQKGMSDAR